MEAKPNATAGYDGKSGLPTATHPSPVITSCPPSGWRPGGTFLHGERDLDLVYN